MPPKTKAPERGLRLTLAGAPATPHVVTGVPGLYRPDVPTLVGDGHPVDLAEAKRLSTDPAVPLELVDVTDVGGAQQAMVDAHLAAAAGVELARRAARAEGTTPKELERISDEAKAIEENA